MTHATSMTGTAIHLFDPMPCLPLFEFGIAADRVMDDEGRFSTVSTRMRGAALGRTVG
ncbi:MAG TPA: hypothetical protein VEX36_02425 [Thermoleophilaceae bacterium]|nr:hypothetical protein [Thermoleophilaceae bacterium]